MQGVWIADSCLLGVMADSVIKRWVFRVWIADSVIKCWIFEYGWLNAGCDGSVTQ